MRQPWPLDGITEFSGIGSISDIIINTSLIDAYLSIGNHDDKFFLIGSKGLGKTTLLSCKSHLYREQFGNSYKFNSSIYELTEKLTIETKTFSRDELLSFRRITDWETLWKLTLWILSFKNYGLEINPELDRLIRNSKRLGTIFSELLSNRKKISVFPRYISEFIDKSSQIRSGVAIFIDDVDQAFEQSILNNEHYSNFYDDNNNKPVVEIWINGQNALLSAIYSIYRQNRHIKIFANIRAEAFHCMRATQKPNIEHHIIQLHYGKSEIKDIFIQNIELIPENQLMYKAGKTPLERFLGFDAEMTHIFATDYLNKKRKESAFDFIFRHTYERPREIVQMGKELGSLVTQKAYWEIGLHQKMEAVRAVATQFADKLFGDYCLQIIPGFDNEQFLNFIKLIKSNCISTEELEQLDSRLTRLYYKLGLLGYVKDEPLGEKTQVFLPAGEYNYNEYLQVPSANYYIMHPTTDQALLKLHTYVGFYYKNAIIGNGYKFFSPQGDAPKPITYYIPHELTGYDGNAPTAGNAYKILAYYDHFFGEEYISVFLKEYRDHIDDAQRILTKLAKICYYYKLNKPFPGCYSKKIQEIKDELTIFAFERPYYAAMNEAVIHKSKSKFLDKLFGRFIAVGAILFLDINPSSVKRLLQSKELDFNSHEDSDDTVYKFFVRNFFIPNLGRKRTLSNDYKNAKNRQAKNAIFAGLSQFEQEELLHLRKTAIEEINMTALEFISQEHVEWLKLNVLGKLFIPTD